MSLLQPQSTSSWEKTRRFSIALIVVALLQLHPYFSFIGTQRNKSIEIKKEAKTTTTILNTAKSERSNTASNDARHGINEKNRNKTTIDVNTTQTDNNDITGKSRKKHVRDKDDIAQVKQKSTNEQKHSGDKFNYTAFWEDATENAFASLKLEHTQPPSPCPKVYVYDLPSKLTDGPRTKTIRNSYGAKMNDDKYKGYLFETSQYALGTILEYRLRNSKQCRTNDPNEADLFFAPIFTKPKYGQAISQQCRKIDGNTVRDALPHLNETNACQHFFTLGKGHYNGHSCKGWYNSPIKELNHTQRLAYSHFTFGKSKNGVHSYKSKDSTSKSYPNLASVPYPSSLHFRAKKSTSKMPQFSNSTKRRTLMSFIGKSNHGDKQVRQRIVRTCKSYKDKTICQSSGWNPKLATAKAKAVFCLEPAGDSPWRKSLSDDITFGCIPVLFSDLTDDVAPWFWQDWKARARVLVPRKEFVAGQIDLNKLLQSTPPPLLELMQTTLREKARKFQYSVDDDQEDGIRVILDNLYREALEMKRQGIC